MTVLPSKHYSELNTTKPQRKRTTHEQLEKRFGEGNMDGSLQVQLEEDPNYSKDIDLVEGATSATKLITGMQNLS